MLSTLQLEWKEREEAGQAEFQRELQKQKDAGVRAVRPRAVVGRHPTFQVVPTGYSRVCRTPF